MEAILEVKDLTKTYKNSKICLDHISFMVPNGTIMGLVGENGSGKTTTIECILNILLKDSGTIKVFGEEMRDEATQLRDEIGVVFDSNNFSELLTPANLSTVLRETYTHWDQVMFQDYIAKFNLPFHSRIKTFSKGMSMKLSIAVALSHHAKLLILDEATSGLDPIIREEILDILLDFVQDENHGILFSSHITSDLDKIADYVTFIHEGKIAFSKKKDELKYSYGILRCKSSQFSEMDRQDILAYRKQDYQIDVLVANKQEVERKYKGVIIDSVSIEDIMILLAKGEQL